MPLGVPVIVFASDVFGVELDTFRWKLTGPERRSAGVGSTFEQSVTFVPELPGRYDLVVTGEDERSRFSKTLVFEARDPFFSAAELSIVGPCGVGIPVAVELALDPGYTLVDVEWSVTYRDVGVEYSIRSERRIEFVPTDTRRYVVAANVRTVEDDEVPVSLRVCR